MIARFNYFSPLGIIKIQADAVGITEVKFVDQSEGANLKPNYPAIKDAVRWLDDYFLGNVPLTYPQFHLNGTDFQQRVWQQLRQIPYGQLAQRLNSSPRAVGNAVGKNPILLFIPCHRILGQNGKLTGYSGGLERKKKLLAIENIKL